MWGIDQIGMTAKEETTMELEDAAFSRISYADAEDGLPGFSRTRLQIPKLTIHKPLERGHLKAAPFGGSEGGRD